MKIGLVGGEYGLELDLERVPLKGELLNVGGWHGEVYRVVDVETVTDSTGDQLAIRLHVVPKDAL